MMLECTTQTMAEAPRKNVLLAILKGWELKDSPGIHIVSSNCKPGYDRDILDEVANRFGRVLLPAVFWNSALEVC